MSEQVNPKTNIVISDPVEIQSSLGAMGLDEELLRDAVRAGMVERAQCSPLDPVSLPGTVLWGRTIRTIRERLIAKSDEWRPVNDRNLPLAVNAVTKLAITVSSGNQNVGNGDRETPPTNRNPKGAVCYDVVETGQRLLFPHSPKFVKTPKPHERITRILLVYMVDDETARCELSLPDTIVNGWITAWRERIMLAPVILDEGPESLREDVETPQEIEVPVTRKEVA